MKRGTFENNNQRKRHDENEGPSTNNNDMELEYEDPTIDEYIQEEIHDAEKEGDIQMDQDDEEKLPVEVCSVFEWFLLLLYSISELEKTNWVKTSSLITTVMPISCIMPWMLIGPVCPLILSMIILVQSDQEYRLWLAIDDL